MKKFIRDVRAKNITIFEVDLAMAISQTIWYIIEIIGLM